MKYVIGIDLGTSAVKILLVNQEGDVVQEISKSYPLIQEKTGYNEQNPEDWVNQTVAGLSDLMRNFSGQPKDIEGLSFSGQMHGLVLLDLNNEIIRPAIIWNDTRTTVECEDIYAKVGRDQLVNITKNSALEGFTLPKILWVKKHEPELFARVNKFLMPKDYVRYKLTGKLHTEYSDAAGTLLLDVPNKKWSKEICNSLDIDIGICPPLVASHDEIGTITKTYAKQTGLGLSTRIFAGGADNACGAVGAGVLEDGKTLCSIGSSGVLLSYEKNGDKDFQGKVHYFNHSAPDSFYTMGVTLAAGYSLSWFKETFASEESFESLLSEIKSVSAGSNGLLFAPYIVGERTPHADSSIRGSFIGIDSSHRRKHFARAVLEGITFSLNESLQIFRENGKEIETIISIGGGAKNEEWLQIQADIFNSKVVRLSSEQGPGLGATMLAAYGCGWFDTLSECADKFLTVEKEFTPHKENMETYKELFKLYQEIYRKTKDLNKKLVNFRDE
ncbi:xylulokinase [Oceanobacillus neutriphilus]|uniref:Xylulose kinase n=1 Tax=Oceanobacillus neutriphilus TaxID=531815 RepID=A0ABQ2NVU7_9BACI|nr:xylulokinase [Oceanobacillus neutriphilus]GGP11800.1 xylulose kinase [Oceanobacillus neutriphilus]